MNKAQEKLAKRKFADDEKIRKQKGRDVKKVLKPLLAKATKLLSEYKRLVNSANFMMLPITYQRDGQQHFEACDNMVNTFEKIIAEEGTDMPTIALDAKKTLDEASRLVAIIKAGFKAFGLA